MAELNLEVDIREKKASSLREGRQAGKIPAVLYGHGIKPQTFWVNTLPFSRVYAEGGESSIINLAPKDGKAVNVLIQDVQLDPVTDRFLHVDFFQVRMDEELEARIPLEFTGEAAAIKELAGVLVKPLEELHISCLPKDLPHSITVDISTLATFDDQIQVKDLPIPAGVKVLVEADTVVALVEPPRSEEELAALDEKVEEDVNSVEGVVKETPVAEGEAAPVEGQPEKSAKGDSPAKGKEEKK